MSNCPLPAEKDLKKKGRGTHACKTDANSGLTVTRWYDNKCVQLAQRIVILMQLGLSNDGAGVRRNMWI